MAETTTPTPTDMLLSKGLPAAPGSLWGLLAKLSWSDPDLVRFTALRFTATVAGGGDAEEATADVVAKHYFLVRRITGYVEQDPGAAAPETFSAQDVAYQVEDRERNLDVYDTSIEMADIAGVGASPHPTPVECDEYPMVFLPGARVVVTFTPGVNFPAVAHSVTAAATRIVRITMYGALVNEGIVDKLLDMNAEALQAAGLLGARRK